jgi:hypothetical protein
MSLEQTAVSCKVTAKDILLIKYCNLDRNGEVDPCVTFYNLLKLKRTQEKVVGYIKKLVRETPNDEDTGNPETRRKILSICLRGLLCRIIHVVIIWRRASTFLIDLRIAG